MSFEDVMSLAAALGPWIPGVAALIIQLVKIDRETRLKGEEQASKSVVDDASASKIVTESMERVAANLHDELKRIKDDRDKQKMELDDLNARFAVEQSMRVRLEFETEILSKKLDAANQSFNKREEEQKVELQVLTDKVNLFEARMVEAYKFIKQLSKQVVDLGGKPPELPKSIMTYE